MIMFESVNEQKRCAASPRVLAAGRCTFGAYLDVAHAELCDGSDLGLTRSRRLQGIQRGQQRVQLINYVMRHGWRYLCHSHGSIAWTSVVTPRATSEDFCGGTSSSLRRI